MESISLREHDPGWKTEFREERRYLLEKLYPMVVDIYHVGSSAVPDLKSKPIIDIAVEATEYPPSQNVIDRLSLLGYHDQGESGVPGRSWFTKGNPRKFNLHFCKQGSIIVKNQLIFRDSLLKCERLRREYEVLKSQHAKGKTIDNTEYALSKSALIERVIHAANENDNC